MPKRLLKRKERAAGVDSWMVDFLTWGHVHEEDYPPEDWKYLAWYALDWQNPGPCANPCMSIAEAWERSKGAILGDWIAEKPGSRPWAWWFFTQPQRPAGQTEIDYLKSNGMLTRAERVLLNKGAI